MYDRVTAMTLLPNKAFLGYVVKLRLLDLG
jgi:hypothetical protein